MSKNNIPEINIGKVNGDVTISADQKGGITSHEINAEEKRNRPFKKTIIIIGALASIVTILAYFGLRPGKESKMPKKDKENISIGDVNRDVVFSQNQSGGITAHSVTVNVNEPLSPEWSIKQSEKISDTEWRTKLEARGIGKLPFFNWNILLTLNTEVIRRQDVQGEVTVGPWMPLSVKEGHLAPNQFFLGFSEFKPGQSLAIFLYTREPIRVLDVATLK